MHILLITLLTPLILLGAIAGIIFTALAIGFFMVCRALGDLL